MTMPGTDAHLLRIVHLEIFGWGGFADRTVYRFAGPVTYLAAFRQHQARAPLDALCWCLTGRVPPDGVVHFPGSPQRRPMPICEVTFVATWTDGDHAITRRSMRDAPDTVFVDGEEPTQDRRLVLPVLVTTHAGSIYRLAEVPAPELIDHLEFACRDPGRQVLALWNERTSPGFWISRSHDDVLIAEPA